MTEDDNPPVPGGPDAGEQRDRKRTGPEQPDQKRAGPEPEQADQKRTGPERTPEGHPIRWTVIVPVVLIAAVALLVGLPLGTVMIMNSSGCCLANGSENTITFWASMVAGFLTLFGMIVTGIFVITAFRVDATAQAKARVAAQEEVWNYIEHYECKLARDLRALKKNSKSAKDAIAQAQKDVETRRDKASSAIATAREETEEAASTARDEIGRAQNGTTEAAAAAQEAIRRTDQEVAQRRDEAIQAIDTAREEIDTAREEAEAAARAVRALADRTAGGPPETGGGPGQSGE